MYFIIESIMRTCYKIFNFKTTHLKDNNTELESVYIDKFEVYYIHIKDNFSYSIFRDLKVIMNYNGFFNATRLCETHGKNYNDWFQLKETQEKIKILSNVQVIKSHEDDWFTLEDHQEKFKTKNTVIVNEHRIVPFYDVKDDEISGTYIYEDLFLDLALWISKDLHYKCLEIINDFYG